MATWSELFPGFTQRGLRKVAWALAWKGALLAAGFVGSVAALVESARWVVEKKAPLAESAQAVASVWEGIQWRTWAVVWSAVFALSVLALAAYRVWKAERGSDTDEALRSIRLNLVDGSAVTGFETFARFGDRLMSRIAAEDWLARVRLTSSYARDDMTPEALLRAHAHGQKVLEALRLANWLHSPSPDTLPPDQRAYALNLEGERALARAREAHPPPPPISPEAGREELRRLLLRDQRAELLDFLREAVRLRAICEQVRADVIGAAENRRSEDEERRKYAKQLASQAQQAWNPVIASTKALEARVNALLDGDPEMRAAFDAGRTVVADVDSPPGWSGIGMYAPYLDKLAQQLTNTLTAHDRRLTSREESR